MADKKQGSSTQGGTHEQHVHAGEQSHKNAEKQADTPGKQGGSHEQHVAAGQQSHKKSR